MSDSRFLEEDRSIKIEKDAISSAIISGDGNKVVIYQYQLERQVEPQKTSQTEEISSNPYKGLLAFQEEDGDRYFGREKQIQKLWNIFRSLHEETTQPEAPLRLLPILGPSGSGKSSLARAGLIPELARRPLPGKSQARVAVLVPGTHPVEALATMLARIATNDQTPVAKTREFAEELRQTSTKTKDTINYDGLRRIVNVLPEIAVSPLVVLVDQFEEVYSLCDNPNERQIFIENLIDAAGDRSGCVSVIITLRSDFLGESQRHPALNQLIAKQGVIVPAMSTEELRRAITKPAEKAGHPLDEAVVNLLLKDTEGREGALPLLQFALTRIWEGLRTGVEPVKTLEQIGGVGGALAEEAQRIYQSLNQDEKKIAQRIFLGLVQLGEGTSDTRRRTNINSLVSYKDKPEHVKKVIGRFAHPGVRLLTLSSLDGKETAEVTHEALFANWGQMRQWLDNSRSDIRFQRRLDEAATIWDENDRPEGSLWRSPDLDLLGNFYQQKSYSMTPLQMEFFQASQQAENVRNHNRKLSIAGLIVGLVVMTTTAGFSWLQLQQTQLREKAVKAEILVSTDPVNALILAIQVTGQNISLSKLPFQKILTPVQSSLLSVVEVARETNRFVHESAVTSIAYSPDSKYIISGSEDGIVRLWDRQGKLMAETKEAHNNGVNFVNFIQNGQYIVSYGEDQTVRLWDLKGNPHSRIIPFKIPNSNVIALSQNGQYIVSGNRDGTIQRWNLNGNLIGQRKVHKSGILPPGILSIALSHNDQYIVSSSHTTVQLWDLNRNSMRELFKGVGAQTRESFVTVAFSPDDNYIVGGLGIPSSDAQGSGKLWLSDLNGEQIRDFQLHNHSISSVAFGPNSPYIVSGGLDDAVIVSKLDEETKIANFQHLSQADSVAFSPDGKYVASGSKDGTILIGDLKWTSISEFNQTDDQKFFPVAYSPDGKYIISGSEDGRIVERDRHGKIVHTFREQAGNVNFITFSPDGKYIISGSEDGIVRLWGREGNPIRQFSIGQSHILGLSSKGQYIVSFDKNGTVQLWDQFGNSFGKGFKMGDITNSGRREPIISLSPDGEIIVTSISGEDKPTSTVRLWDLKGNQIGKTFQISSGVTSIALSPDGKKIVTGNLDSTVQLWDLKGNQISEPFRGHNKKEPSIRSVTFSPDGQYVVSKSICYYRCYFYGNQTLRLWDLEGNPISNPRDMDSTNFLVSPDSKYILNSNGGVFVGNWQAGLEVACDRLRYHPVLVEGKTDEASGARETCQKYVWDKTETISSPGTSPN